MLVALKRQWHGLQRSQPGHRFQNRYASARRHRDQVPTWQRLLQLGASLVLLAAGVVFVFIPGPAILFFALAGAMLASESRTVARALDWTELRIRSGWHRAARFWSGLGVGGRVALLSLLAALVGAAGFVAWRIFFR
jgi:hypothetical protein